MKTLQEVYPPSYRASDNSEFFSECDYRPMLESMGFKIVLQVDDEDYQGDSRILFKDGQKWGMLIFGWGSCSGCDALQACDTYEEAEKLRKRLLNDIEWHESKEALLERINTKDWELDWSWHSDETKQFIEKVKKLLESQ